MIEPALLFFCPGVPRPQGSKKILRNRHTGIPVMVEDNIKLHAWRAAVRNCAAMYRREMIHGAVVLSARFVFVRPKSHYNKGGSLTPRAPRFMTTKPDLSKLVRAVEDSLTDARVWSDDSYVIRYRDTLKEWGQTPGVHVAVYKVPDDDDK